ncbi:MAG: 3-oxoadipate enol-lactonase [Chloroflexota bacterium]
MSLTQFMQVGDIALHYRLDGQPLALTGGQTPLVFINSLGSDLRIWDGVVSHFAATHAIVRYDKRGHGLSDCPPAPYTMEDHRDDLAGVLDGLGITKAILIGISVGGMITMSYALAHPERVSALVMCDTAAKIGEVAMWNERVGILRKHGMAHLGNAILSRWFAPAFAETQPAAYRGYYNMLTRTPVDGYTGTCEALRDADMREQVGSITTPSLVICGAEDLATTPAMAQELADALPNSKLDLIDGAAHLPCIEQPDQMAAVIAQFLSSQSSVTEKFDQGMVVRRAVLGDRHVDRAEKNKTPFDAGFQRMITEFAWGMVWSGDTLDRRDRHLLTIGLMAALGKEHELAMHIRATQNTGVTSEEVKEVFHQVAVYAGVPAANRAFAVAKEVYAELED